MPTMNFHDNCSSVAEWIHGDTTYGSILHSDGSKLYYTEGPDNPGNLTDHKAMFYGYNIPATVNFTFTIKLSFDPAIQADSLVQEFYISLCETHEYPYNGLFWIRAVIHDDGSSSPTIRYVSVVVPSDAWPGDVSNDFKYSQELSADTEELEIKIVKSTENNSHYIDIYYDESFKKRIDVTSYVDSTSLSFIKLLCYFFQDDNFQSWARINDINLDWTLVPIESFSLDKHDITLIKYQSETVNIIIDPANAYGIGVDVISDDESIAVPLVAGMGVGETYVRATFNTIDPETLAEYQLTDSVRVTVLNNVLETPDKPTWADAVLSWNAIEHAAGYTINLYVVSDQYTGQFSSASAETNSYDLISDLQSIYTSGLTNITSVTATVIADGDDDPYCDSEESEPSNNFAPTALPQVKQPTWADYKLTWEDVDNALSYIVRLYNESGTAINTQTIAPGVRIADFSSILSTGTFTATVQASEVAPE